MRQLIAAHVESTEVKCHGHTNLGQTASSSWQVGLPYLTGDEAVVLNSCKQRSWSSRDRDLGSRSDGANVHQLDLLLSAENVTVYT